MQVLTRKMGAVLVAGALGALAGAWLGYGPLLRYKAEGVMSMDMGVVEYKRFTELANDSLALQNFVEVNPAKGMSEASVDGLMGAVRAGQWQKAVPKVSKADAKDVPDFLLNPLKALEKDIDRDRESDREPPVYFGLRITHTSAVPEDAAQGATWLGLYFKEVATKEALREKVAHWAAQNRQFFTDAMERKLQYEFQITQAQTRALALKTLVASYPAASQRDTQQVVDVRRDNEKFMSPLSQLVAAETEVINSRGQIQKLERQLEQEKFVEQLLRGMQASVDKARSGSEGVAALSQALKDLEASVKTDAEREKLLSLSAEVSKVSSRYLYQAEFVAKPSVPSTPEKPGPRMFIALGGLLLALLAALLLWHKALWRLLREDEEGARRPELV